MVGARGDKPPLGTLMSRLRCLLRSRLRAESGGCAARPLEPLSLTSWRRPPGPSGSWFEARNVAFQRLNRGLEALCRGARPDDLRAAGDPRPGPQRMTRRSSRRPAERATDREVVAAVLAA